MHLALRDHSSLRVLAFREDTLGMASNSCLEILLCQMEFLLCTRGGNVFFANLFVSNDYDLFGRLVCRAEMEGKVLEEATLAPHLLNDSRVVLGVSNPLSP